LSARGETRNGCLRFNSYLKTKEPVLPRFSPFLRLPLPCALLLLLVLPLTTSGQTIVKGKVTDARSGDPIPFANIIFQGTTNGTTTDFDGNFVVKTSEAADSIVVSYLGYTTRTRKIKQGVAQVMNFQLEELTTALNEIVFESGENTTYEILRNDECL